MDLHWFSKQCLLEIELSELFLWMMFLLARQVVRLRFTKCLLQLLPVQLLTHWGTASDIPWRDKSLQLILVRLWNMISLGAFDIPLKITFMQLLLQNWGAWPLIFFRRWHATDRIHANKFRIGAPDSQNKQIKMKIAEEPWQSSIYASVWQYSSKLTTKYYESLNIHNSGKILSRSN